MSETSTNKDTAKLRGDLVDHHEVNSESKTERLRLRTSRPLGETSTGRLRGKYIEKQEADNAAEEELTLADLRVRHRDSGIVFGVDAVKENPVNGNTIFNLVPEDELDSGAPSKVLNKTPASLMASLTEEGGAWEYVAGPHEIDRSVE